jgi:two-component system, cell cycle response regulator
MTQAHKIVLVGFSSFEKVTFESFFRLAARRPPGYVLVADAAQANLAVVNADDVAVLRQCIAVPPAAKVLLIGNQDGGTGWPLQKRPLNLMKVLATVESLLAPAASAATVPAALMPTSASSPSTASPASSVSNRPAIQAPPAGIARPSQVRPTSPSAPSTARVDTGPDSTMRRSVRAGSGVGTANSSYDSSRAGDIGGFAHSNISKAPSKNIESDVDHILVVDDSDIALKFMRNRLSRFGFNADLVNSGEEALGRMNAKPYKFVFLDVMMEGLDGYQTCRAIKQRKYSDGKPPVVVMLTSRGGTIDKIRGTLAGCDAYLTKPLNERDLIAVLAKHDRNVARGFQETNFGSNSGSGFARSHG